MQHVFSHQQYQPESWIQHQQQAQHHGQHYGAHLNQHSQVQAAAAASAAAQQNHYSRIAAGQHNSNTHHSTHSISMNNDLPAQNTADNGLTDENRRVLNWVAELLEGSSRETALMELSKKREQVPELALIIWHSFGE